MISKKISGRLGGVVFATLGSISCAYAADGTLYMTGDVTTSTCVVDVAGTTSQFGTIPLNSISKSQISTGSEGVSNPSKRLHTDFYIKFNTCPANETYTLSLDGPHKTLYDTFESEGAGNPELVVMMKNDDGDFVLYNEPIEYEVGADSRSHLMDVNLYLGEIGSLTYGDINYTVDYTVEFG